MKEPFFNLIDEPWIKVMMCDGREDKVSLKDIFSKSQDIRSILGETVLQDNAILRVLIAISVTCFYRYNCNGNELPLQDEDDAIERFREIWNNKHFPNSFIGTYLYKWRDSFFLFDSERPFYQIPQEFIKEVKSKVDKKNPNGVTYLVSPFKDSDKLSWNYAMTFNGEVLQSGNTVSPFSNKGNEEKNRMNFDEAARWLIYYMNYADCSSKIPGKWNAGMTFTSSGANIHPVGQNLFETLMLCSVLFDVNGLLYPQVAPSWETGNYSEINSSPYGEAMPDNLPELYTQISRKVILHYNDGYVDGMYTAAGDRFGTVNSFIEPMFAFHADSSDKSGNTKKPSHMPSNCVGWKEYKNIFMSTPSNPSRWVNALFDSDILSYDTNIPYGMSDIAYGSMQCGVDYTTNTRLVLSPKYFIDSVEINRASEEIEHINEISSVLKRFGQRIDCAYGAKKDSKGRLVSKVSNRLVEEYELSAGGLIESYLRGDMDDLHKLHEEAVKMAERVSDRVLEGINIIGFIGHGDQYIGDAENGLNKDLYLIKKKLGLMEGGEIK